MPRVVKLKTKYNNVVGLARMVAQNLEEDRTWAWANTPGIRRTITTKLESITGDGAFKDFLNKLWVVELKYLKIEYNTDELGVMFESFLGLEPSVDELNATCKKPSAAHKALR